MVLHVAVEKDVPRLAEDLAKRPIDIALRVEIAVAADLDVRFPESGWLRVMML